MTDPGAERDGADPIPRQVGPCRFGRVGTWITVHCPPDYDTLMRNAGGTWDPDHHRWLIEQRRMGQLLRHLRRRIDTLFRQAGDDLDAAE